MEYLTSLALNLAERGVFPDLVIRGGIRHLFKERLREIRCGDAQTAASQEIFIKQMRRAPIAVVPEKANDQHYVSSAFWPAGTTTLAQAEAAGRIYQAADTPRVLLLSAQPLESLLLL